VGKPLLMDRTVLVLLPLLLLLPLHVGDDEFWR
jgi:hypothetical protein